MNPERGQSPERRPFNLTIGGADSLANLRKLIERHTITLPSSDGTKTYSTFELLQRFDAAESGREGTDVLPSADGLRDKFIELHAKEVGS
ncbi:hypothetical protein ACFL0L_00025 [Patescibacteria group bacterium]